MDDLKLGRLLRDFSSTQIEIKRDASKPVELSFPASSEAPVDRWFGSEILSHEASAIRMTRVSAGAVPLLFNHNWDDPIGMVDRAAVLDSRLVVDAHLFATARAAEVGAMLDGGLHNVSIGYQVHTFEEQTKSQTFTATDWEPLEVSVVTIPADPSVGIGRSPEDHAIPVRVVAAGSPPARNAEPKGAITMADVKDLPAGAPAEPISPAPTGEALEAQRIKSIQQFCKANGLQPAVERSWIERGCGWDAVSDEFLKMKELQRETLVQTPAFLDMGKKDEERYSLMRAIRASVNKDWTKAGLELEANRAVAKRMNRIPRSETAFFVPLDVLMRDAQIQGYGRRDMTVAGVSGSQYLVGTTNLAGSFIDLLRNTSVALRMGVNRLAGLVGNVTIPKMTAGNTAYWLSDEGTQITESQPTIGQLPLAPKNVAALTELSHQLIQQSTPDAEQIVLSSIARDIALAVDAGVIKGTGANGQPQGIVGTSGVGSVTGTSLAAAGIVEFQTDVAANNGLLPGFGYATTPAVAGLLMARPELPSTGTTRLWQGNVLDGSLFGFPAMASNQMATATMLAGSWPTVVLAEWGVLELMTNPFSDFTRGLTAIRGWYTCDVGVRYPGAFSYSSSIT